MVFLFRRLPIVKQQIIIIFCLFSWQIKSDFVALHRVGWIWLHQR